MLVGGWSQSLHGAGPSSATTITATTPSVSTSSEGGSSSEGGPVRRTKSRRPAPYYSKPREAPYSFHSPQMSTPTFSTCTTPTLSDGSLPATPSVVNTALPMPLEAIPFLEIKWHKSRNQRLDITEEEIQSIVDNASGTSEHATPCPKCPGKRILLRDLKRHLYTHADVKRFYICAGVPLAQAPNDGVKRELRRHPVTGEVCVGGCGIAFAERKDSYKRHLSNRRCTCLRPAGM